MPLTEKALLVLSLDDDEDSGRLGKDAGAVDRKHFQDFVFDDPTST